MCSTTFLSAPTVQNVQYNIFISSYSTKMWGSWFVLAPTVQILQYNIFSAPTVQKMWSSSFALAPTVQNEQFSIWLKSYSAWGVKSNIWTSLTSSYTTKCVIQQLYRLLQYEMISAAFVSAYTVWNDQCSFSISLYSTKYSRELSENWLKDRWIFLEHTYEKRNNKCSDRSMEVKLPPLLPPFNEILSDRPNNRPTNHPPTRQTGS